MGEREQAGTLREQALAHRQDRDYAAAVRCYREAARLSDAGAARACLMDCWRTYVWAIAGCEYDCGFEWRGATDGSHDDDHDYYQGAIAEYRGQAVELLADLLAHAGWWERHAILREAQRECGRLKKGGGWGVSRCHDIIRAASSR